MLLKKYLSFLFTLLIFSGAAFARGASGPKPESSLNNPLAIALLMIIAALALIIVLLAWVVNGAAGVYIEKYRKGKSVTTSATLTLLLLLGAIAPATAQETASAISTPPLVDFGGLEKSTFYILVGVIGVELVTILYFIYNLRLLIRAEQTPSSQAVEAAVPAKPKVSWWSKLNRFKPVEQEADLDLGHEYDGIRELDNRLPPWWLYGFYACIVFAAIYLWRYHVSHSAPSSVEEYQIAMLKAEAEKEQYLKNAANKVDENTVVMLDASGIAAGQSNFVTNCAACHGKQGEGGVGPNLTDDYWLHGGNISDIFKSIKYGIPEKGMRSWKDDLSPVQIAQLTSYIKSLHGTNPPNAKEKQGELVTDSLLSAK